MYFSFQMARHGGAHADQPAATKVNAPAQRSELLPPVRLARKVPCAWSSIWPPILLLGMCCVGIAAAPLAGAAPIAQAAVHEQGLLGNFRHLAQMRPRRCATDELPVPVAGWHEGQMQCAWQGRLMVRGWTSRPLAATDCVSPAALWWRRVRERHPDALLPSTAWHRTWTTQHFASSRAGARYIAIVARTEDGGWMASEWRWLPSERPATRRWQEGRWNLLAEAAQRLVQPVPVTAVQGNVPLQSVRSAWERLVGPAPGEYVADQWRWVSDGRCLTMDGVGVTQSSFQLPYLLDDSRLEQRAAMQLQLARRQPGAVWLRPFSLVDSALQSKSGLARYKAVWREQGQVRGQLWIPAKGDGPILRLRLSTPVQESVGNANPEAQIIERELERMSKLVGHVDG